MAGDHGPEPIPRADVDQLEPTTFSDPLKSLPDPPPASITDVEHHPSSDHPPLIHLTGQEFFRLAATPIASSDAASSWEAIDHDNRELRQQNEQLMDWISELEESFNQCQSALQLQRERCQHLEQLLSTAGRGASPKPSADEVATSQQLQKQRILVDTLTLQLHQSQERASQLEKEYVLTQKRFAEQTQRLVQVENECRSLKTRLSRQQRYTLQFKAALERCLEVSVPVSVGADEPDPKSSTPPADLECENPGLFPRSAPVAAWSSESEPSQLRSTGLSDTTSLSPGLQKVAQFLNTSPGVADHDDGSHGEDLSPEPSGVEPLVSTVPPLDLPDLEGQRSFLNLPQRPQPTSPDGEESPNSDLDLAWDPSPLDTLTPEPQDEVLTPPISLEILRQAWSTRDGSSQEEVPSLTLPPLSSDPSRSPGTETLGGEPVQAEPVVSTNPSPLLESLSLDQPLAPESRLAVSQDTLTQDVPPDPEQELDQALQAVFNQVGVDDRSWAARAEAIVSPEETHPEPEPESEPEPNQSPLSWFGGETELRDPSTPEPTLEPYRFWQTLAQAKTTLQEPPFQANPLERTPEDPAMSGDDRLDPAQIDDIQATDQPDSSPMTAQRDPSFPVLNSPPQARDDRAPRSPGLSLVLPGESLRTPPTPVNQLLTPTPSLHLSGNSPSPLVYPLRPTKKRESLAAIELPRFPN